MIILWCCLSYEELDSLVTIQFLSLKKKKQHECSASCIPWKKGHGEYIFFGVIFILGRPNILLIYLFMRWLVISQFWISFLRIASLYLAIDPSQRLSPLHYCCYVQQAMPFSRHTSCSHTVKNTSRSKEETDNVPTDKTEQVTLGMKQSLSFKMLSFFYKFQQ